MPLPKSKYSDNDPRKIAHEPTDLCYDLHCLIHQVDEAPDNPYIVCFECNHAFTKRELRRLYLTELKKVRSDRFDFPDLPPDLKAAADAVQKEFWAGLTLLQKIRIARQRVITLASDITFCPVCLHDF